MSHPEVVHGQWDTDAHDKTLVGFINLMHKNMSVPGLAQTKRAFTSKDLLTLTPQQFREVVGFIFYDRVPREMQTALESRDSRVEKLSHFNTLYKDFSVGFDPEPAIFYKALKTFFPPELDLLRPSVILNPSGDSIRTRKVLRYLTGLLVFIDNTCEDFENISEQVLAEVNERSALLKTLDDLKSDINKKMIEQDNWKMEVGPLKKLSQERMEEIAKLERKTADIEERVQKESISYKRLEEQKVAAFRELEGVLQEIEDTSQLLVDSPERILEELKTEKAKLQHLNQLRDSCNQKLQEASQSGRVAAITEEAEKTIYFFHDLVQLMQEAIDAKNSWAERQASVPQKLQLIEEMKMKIENIGNSLPASLSAQLSELTEIFERLDAEYMDQSNYSSELTENLKNLKRQREAHLVQLAVKQSEAAKLEEIVKECENYILVELPQKRALLEELVLNSLDALEQEFNQVMP